MKLLLDGKKIKFISLFEKKSTGLGNKKYAKSKII